MSKGKAFFSTLPGIISALAGLVTVIVGVLAIAAQLGWLSDDDDGGGGAAGGDRTTSTTVTSGTAPGGGSSPTTVAPRISVEPRSVTFAALAAKKQKVTVKNEGTAPVTLRPPEMAGADRAQFSAAFLDCSSSLGGGRSCDVEITFAPTRQGRYTARLVVTPANGVAVEVPVVGDHLL